MSTNWIERTVGVKTKKDVINKLLISFPSASKLYFGPQREPGLHFEYLVTMEGKSDFLRLTEKEGEKVINTSEFHLYTDHVPALEMIVSLVGSMGATPANWWDTVGTES